MLAMLQGFVNYTLDTAQHQGVPYSSLSMQGGIRFLMLRVVAEFDINCDKEFNASGLECYRQALPGPRTLARVL